MVVDNVDKIRGFLNVNLEPEHENKEFYKFDVMVRKKDNPENIFMKHHKGSFLLHSWLISSVEQYDKYIDEMVSLCLLTGARLYMTVDRKSTEKMTTVLSDSAHDLMKSMLRNNQISTKNVFNIMNSITSKNEISVHNARKLLFDIDNMDTEAFTQTMLALCALPEELSLMTLNTPNGWHIITDRFDRTLLPNDVLNNDNLDIKENALTLVYFDNLRKELQEGE